MPSTPPLQFSHLYGQEIPTKNKEAIRQLHAFAKVPIIQLEKRYFRLLNPTYEKRISLLGSK
jgi:hypothetical protein